MHDINKKMSFIWKKELRFFIQISLPQDGLLDGEQFSYDMLQLMNEIYMDNELVVYDHIKLNPATQNINALGFMEGFSHLGSMIVVGEQTTPELLDRLYHVDSNRIQMNIKLDYPYYQLPGFTVRVLANSTQMIERIFTECHHMISQEWFNTTPSFLRKY